MKRSGSNDKHSRRVRVFLKVLQRVAAVAVIGGALWMAWWSVNRLALLQKKSADLTQNASRLAVETELMLAQQTPEKAESVNLRFDGTRRVLFDSGDAIGEWREQLQEAAVPLALDTAVQFQGIRSNTIGDQSLTLIQAVVNVTPARGVPPARPMYQRVLDFTHQLATQPRRVDILELRVEGGTNSVGEASATVELWATDSPAAPSS
jgi:hypothetical protein